MATPTSFSVIVVGAGRWGSRVITTAYELDVLIAIVDTDNAALEKVMEMIGPNSSVRHYNTLSAALARHPTANVVVATPPKSHFDLARQAICEKRHVFIEKPLCTSVREASFLVDYAKKAGVKIMVNHLLQYSVPHRTLIQAVKSGYVGQVTRIKMTRMNFGTVRSEENVLWSFTPHDVSLLLSICNDEEPKSVACVGQTVLTESVEDYIDMTLRFPSGIQAQIEASWMHPVKERRLIVYGTTGALILNESMPGCHAPTVQGFHWSSKRTRDGSIVVIDKSEQTFSSVNTESESREFEADPAVPPLSASLQHFSDCIDDNSKITTDGEEGVRVLKVLETASESLRLNGAAVDMESQHGIAEAFVHQTAVVDNRVSLGAGTKVWHFAHIMPGAKVGKSCVIGQNVYIGGQARLGNNVKVQNNVSIYDGVTIEDDVFLGPSCVFTNVKTPRAHVNRRLNFVPTTICKGASVGANATIVCGVKLGDHCFVGAGSVVTKDVAPHEMVYGNPATCQGWVSTHGLRLKEVAEVGPDFKIMQCSVTKEMYSLHENGREGFPNPHVVPITRDSPGYLPWIQDFLTRESDDEISGKDREDPEALRL